MNISYYTMPIKSVNTEVKSIVSEKYGVTFAPSSSMFRINNKVSTLKVARMTNNSEPATYEKFKDSNKWVYHLNQIYLKQYNNVLLCMIFLDTIKFIEIPIQNLYDSTELYHQHKQEDCFQCNIDLRKYIDLR